MLNSLIEKIDSLEYSELLSEAVKPALRVFVQNDTAIRIMGMADIKLKPFRELTDFSHLTATYNSFETDAVAIKNRRDMLRKRLVSIGVSASEIKQAGYAAITNGEIYAFVIKDKKLNDKDRHTKRTDSENDAVSQVKLAASMAKDMEALIQAGQRDRALEKQTDVINAIKRAGDIMKSDAFITATKKRDLKDTGRDYVYFIVNETRDGKRGVSTVYESQLPATGTEFIAYKVVIGTKKR